MENNHLTYFKIENFKKFESLEVNDIGQFNLIVGDNNVGKTCLLEALLLNTSIKENLGLFNTLLKVRNPQFQSPKMSKENSHFNADYNLFTICSNNREKPFRLLLKKNDSSLNFEYRVENIYGKLKDQHNTELKNFAKNVIEEYPEIDELSENWLFAFLNNKPIYIVDVTSKYYKNFVNVEYSTSIIQMKDGYDSTLFIKYSLLNPNQEKELVFLLNNVFTDLQIQNIRINQFEIQITTKTRNYYHPISEYGGGMMRYFRFIIEIIQCEDNRIMIDEVEIGVHHTKYKEFWKNILKLVENKKIQLFATTHSQECTEAYIQASADLDVTNNIRLIKLEESTNKDKIYSSTFTYNQISAGLDSNVELRG